MMKRYIKTTFLLMMSSALVTGCGGGGGGSSGGGGSNVFNLNDGPVYQRALPAVNTNWSGAGNWELGAVVGGVLQASSKSQDVAPTVNSTVVLGSDSRFATVNVTGDDVNQSLKILCINGPTLNINGVGKNFEVKDLRMLDGTVNVQAGQLTIGSGRFLGGTIRPNGGRIVLSGEKFVLDGGTFDADIIIPGGLEFLGNGRIEKSLINRDVLTLTVEQKLTVASFNNTGTVKVYLVDSAPSTVELLKATGGITLGGKLEVYGGKIGTYTLLKGTSINGDFASSNNGFTKIKTNTEYMITLNAVNAALPASSSIASPMFRNALSMGLPSSGFYLSALQSGMDVMPHAVKFNLTSDVTMTMNTQNNEKFFALNTSHKNGSFGLYLGYEGLENSMQKMDFGAYDMRSFGGFKLTNLVHMGKNEALTLNSDLASQVKTSFFQVRSELSHAFKVVGVTLSPKVMTSYGKLIDVSGLLKTDGDSFHMETTGNGSLEAGVGLDLASKFNIREVPVEAFASFNVSYANGDNVILVREGDGKRLQNEAGIKSSLALGFKATLDSKTNVYGNMNLSSQTDNSIEFGFRFKL